MEHPAVIGVLNIARNILNENKNLDIDTLYRTAKKTLKMPRKGLLKVIDFLLNRKVLIEGSKFTKKSVLSNPNRRIIYDFINQNIGAHFSLIRKEVFADDHSATVGNGQLIWHLEMLLKFEHIKKTKVKNNTIFFPSHVSENFSKLHFFLRDDINKKIIQLLLENDSLELSEIHKKLGINRQKVYYRVNNLIESELIISDGQDDKSLSINSSLKDTIAEIIYQENQNLSIKEEYPEQWH